MHSFSQAVPCNGPWVAVLLQGWAGWHRSHFPCILLVPTGRYRARGVGVGVGRLLGQTTAVPVSRERHLLCWPEELCGFFFLTGTTFHRHSFPLFLFTPDLCDTEDQTQAANACKANTLPSELPRLSFTHSCVCTCIVGGNVGAPLLRQVGVEARGQPQGLGLVSSALRQGLVYFLCTPGQLPFKLPKILCLLPMSPRERCDHGQPHYVPGFYGTSEDSKLGPHACIQQIIFIF